MGSRPSKVAPSRPRSGLSFVSTSSVESLETIATDEGDESEGVKNFVFNEISTKSFQVSWDPPDNFYAICYQVRLFPPDKIKSRTLLRELPNSQHTFTRLNPCTQYTVAVIAIDGSRNKSPCSSAAVWTLPQPPTDIQFPSKIRSDSLQIYWKHCKGRPGKYDVVVLAESENVPVALVKGLTENSYLFKNMIPGTNYTVSVRNTTNGHSSDPLIGTVMTAPRHVCDIIFSDVTQHEMTLKWKKPKGRVDSYTLEMSPRILNPGEPIKIEGLKKTFYIFKGLTPGRLYSFKITTNVEKTSSRPKMFTQCTVPLEVAGITTREVGPEEALITWTPALGEADDYDLFLAPKVGVKGETAPRGIKETQYRFTGLVPGTTYTVGIVTNSKDKASKRVVSTFVTVSGMNGDLEVSTTERTCTTQRISWAPASGQVDSYTISIRKDDNQEDGSFVRDIFKSYHLLTGLSPGTLYRAEVIAMRDGRELSSIHKVFGTVPSPVPSLFFPVEQCSWDQIACSWEASIGEVESYFVEVKCKGGVSKEVTVSSEKVDHIFTSLRPATEYEFSVTVISNDIKSISNTAKQITGPSSVTDFSVKSNHKAELLASWTPPGHGADEYVLKLTPLEDGSSEPHLTLSSSKQEHTFLGLIPGSLYHIEILPFQSFIKGKACAAEVYTKPGSVMNVYIPEELVTTDSITIKWDGVEGNCKNVNVILSRIQRGQNEHVEPIPVVISEEQICAEDGGSNEVVFTDLEPDTVYGIRLRAVRKAEVGIDSVFTQKTLPSVTKLSEKQIDSDFNHVADKVETKMKNSIDSVASNNKASDLLDNVPNISPSENNLLKGQHQVRTCENIQGSTTDTDPSKDKVSLSLAEKVGTDLEGQQMLIQKSNENDKTLSEDNIAYVVTEPDGATQLSPVISLEQESALNILSLPSEDSLHGSGLLKPAAEKIAYTVTSTEEALNEKNNPFYYEEKALKDEVSTNVTKPRSPVNPLKHSDIYCEKGALINQSENDEQSCEREGNPLMSNLKTSSYTISPTVERKSENRLSFLATLASVE